ncbi:hypothetical protein [Xylella fastidiosa]|uniref:hypothetical protein n=1 Tax=Xylella fastidiosa TaxID=2371 RepID=UPI00083E9A4A|nr:hypothetical protein [Xylella fastidiosa]
MAKISDGSRAHKRVKWRRPSGKRRPGVIEATTGQLIKSIEQRYGSLWLILGKAAIIAAYPFARAFDRIRTLRSDGAESLLALAVLLMNLVDVRTGFIGKPNPVGGRWHRYTLADIAQLAYGSQKAADIARARRSLKIMIALGWAEPTKQVRRYACDEMGTAMFTSEPGVRRLNLDKLCKMTGTGWLLKRDRKHADSLRGPKVIGIGNIPPLSQSGQNMISPPHSAQEQEKRQRPASTGDPPKSETSKHIGDILNLLYS